MLNYTTKAETLVETWLRGEDEYQFSKNKITHNSDPQSSIAHILGSELGNKWHRFQIFNLSITNHSNNDLCLRAGQLILKTVGAARGALVWEYSLGGCSVDQGSDQTWDVLNQHFDDLNRRYVELPAIELLNAPFNTAIHPATVEPTEGIYNVKPIFTRLVSLAIVYLLQQEEQFGGEITIPKPGVASGDFQTWQP